MSKAVIRLVAAALGVVLVALLAYGGVAAYRAIVRFGEPLPPEPGLVQVPLPPRPKETPLPKVAEERPPCPIVPEPKVYKESGRTAELSADAAIVLGARATEPERYAAERLQGLIERRFKRKLTVRSEDGLEGGQQLILLGQRGTNSLLDRLCGEKKFDLSAESPGHDGFVIEAVEDGGRQAVLIGGSNARGVTYGQEALFDLLRWEGDAPAEPQRERKIVFPVVSVRDWPSLAWRGRIEGNFRNHLKPGALDAYVRARLNLLDTRNGGVYRGDFGFAPGESPDSPELRELIKQAHRRGILIHGTLACSFGVKVPLKVERTAKELVALGVDGLSLIFCDLGAPEGSAELVQHLLGVAKGLGLSGQAISSVPPMGAYQHVVTDYAHAMAKVPGFDAATWFFTCLPTREVAEGARQVGLKHPAWWHNWPRTGPGLLHKYYGGWSLREGDAPAYLDLLPLAAGWNSPKYEGLRDAAKHVNTAIYCGGWPEEAFGAVFGFWAWHPEKHDWRLTAQAIRAYIFGAAQVGAAQAYDDALASLKMLFAIPKPQVIPGYNWPPHLLKEESRPDALRLLDDMDAALAKLEASAPAHTMIAPERLEKYYLEPMRATATAGRRLTTYEFPGRPLVVLEDKLLALFADQGAAAAEAEFLRARGPLLKVIGDAGTAVSGLQMTKEWLAELRERLGRFAYWTAYAERRQGEIRDAFARLYPKEAEPPEVPAILHTPPQGQALAELAPRDWLARPVVARGLWTAGVAPAVAEKPAAVGSRQKADGGGEKKPDGGDPKEAKGVPEKETRPRFDLLILTHPLLAGWQPIAPGEYVEVRAEMPVPKNEGALTLQVPLALVAGGMQADCIVAELWANGQRVLEHDAAIARPTGEWLNIGVAQAAKGADRLKLRLRLTNRRTSGRFRVVAHVGTVRLLAGEPAAEGGRPMTLPTGGNQ